MAGSVNKVILVGNLGRDPEIRSTQDGTRVATLNLATSENWRDRASGERKERTEWHRVAIFNDRLVEIAEKYLRKGSKIYVEGQLQTRKWTDQQGQDRYTTEVVLSRFRGELTMLDGAGGAGGGRGGAGGVMEPGYDEGYGGGPGDLPRYGGTGPSGASGGMGGGGWGGRNGRRARPQHPRRAGRRDTVLTAIARTPRCRPRPPASAPSARDRRSLRAAPCPRLRRRPGG